MTARPIPIEDRRAPVVRAGTPSLSWPILAVLGLMGFVALTLALSAGVDLTAYRLVQEGLTNAIKHARAQHAEVVVRYGDEDVEVTVTDDGPGGGDGDGGGHGLVGIRERVSVYGGELEAGPRAGGGFQLRARLPVS